MYLVAVEVDVLRLITAGNNGDKLRAEMAIGAELGHVLVLRLQIPGRDTFLSTEQERVLVTSAVNGSFGGIS